MTILEIPPYFYNHFETIQSLEQYFKIEIKKTDHALSRLNDTIVIIPDAKSNIKYFPKHECDLDTLLDNIIASFANQPHSHNVLTTSHKRSCLDLRTDGWKALLSRVGAAMIMRLLLNNIILMKLPNNAFIQLAGFPIHKRMETKMCEKGEYKSETRTFLSNQVNGIMTKVFNTRKRESDDGDKKSNKKAKCNHYMTVDMNRGALIGPYPADKKSVPEQEYAIKTLETLFADEFKTNKKRKHFLKRFSSLPDIIQKIHHQSKVLPKRQFRDHFCPINNGMNSHYQVYMFTTGYIRKCIPIEFFGSVNNLNVLLRGIKSFISRKKHEQLRMDEVLHQFKINGCQWLSSHNNRSPPSDLEKKNTVLTTMIKWIFDDTILPLIKKSFHVTTHSSHKNDLYYFRHDVWNEMTRNHMNRLIETKYFIRMEKRQLVKLKLGSGRLRFVPKNNGLRLITNLSNTIKLIFDPSTTTLQETQISTNKLLATTLNALRHERIQQPDAMGGSVFGNNLLYTRLKEYKKEKVQNNSKFYFCKVDAKNCYDSINQEKLLDELEHFLSSPEYIYRHVLKCCAKTDGRPFVSRDLVATTKDQKYPFSEYIYGMGGGLSGYIIMEQVTSFKKQVSDLYLLLKEHIKTSTVKYNGKFYKKSNGIPQGSCLSALLCSFFYGKLEQEKLGILKQDKDGILLHYIDDFLYITKDIQYANLFLNIINEGFPDFGFQINKSKTLTNVDNEMEVFPWLSYLINVNNLDVLSDMSDTIPKIYFADKPGKHLLSAIKSSLKIESAKKILMDPGFNSHKTVIRNMRDNFRKAAMKMEMITFQTRKGIFGYLNERFIFDSIIKLSHEVVSATPDQIDKNDVLRLYLEEFYKIFIKKKAKYPRVLKCLKMSIKKHTYTKKMNQMIQ